MKYVKIRSSVLDPVNAKALETFPHWEPLQRKVCRVTGLGVLTDGNAVQASWC